MKSLLFWIQSVRSDWNASFSLQTNYFHFLLIHMFWYVSTTHVSLSLPLQAHSYSQYKNVHQEIEDLERDLKDQLKSNEQLLINLRSLKKQVTETGKSVDSIIKSSPNLNVIHDGDANYGAINMFDTSIKVRINTDTFNLLASVIRKRPEKEVIFSLNSWIIKTSISVRTLNNSRLGVHETQSHISCVW